MRRFLLIWCLIAAMVSVARADLARDYSVQASAEVSTEPPRISFHWPAHTETLGYTVFRRHRDDPDWGPPRASLPGSATGYTDTAVVRGTAYEYRFVRSAQRDTVFYTGYGYVYAGIDVPPEEHRGTVMLLTEQSIEQALAPEIDRLERDFRGDGWLVVRRSARRDDSPQRVREQIVAVYRADPSTLKAVVLLGHIPVPYSGHLFPDGHPDHAGAWPADVYYADMDGVWTDAEVDNDTLPERRPQNRNVPGDGKFDQDVLPSDAELMVGRIDLSSLPMYNHSEVELLRRYLDKNHLYRHNRAPVVRRGLIDDNFKGGYIEGFGANGWRNFSALFGAAAIDTGDFIRSFSPAGDVALTDSFYLWSYGCGAGNFISAAFVAHGSELAADSVDMNTVFTMLFGSYFGDWDSENNFMRMALASRGYILTSCWAGRPFWYVHHMALGATIGYATRLAQNNDSLYQSNPAFPFVARMVHTALMGDPTLRLHTVSPPTGLEARKYLDTRSVELHWLPAGQPVAGYHVYRAASPGEPFQRLNREPLAETTYTDSLPVAGADVRYMVRAVVLETSGGGTYFNLSQGVETAVRVEHGFTGEPVWVYPNPAQSSCTVEIVRAGAEPVVVDVFDLSGKRVAVPQEQTEGELVRVRLGVGMLAPGVYTVRVLRAGEYIERRVVVR